MPLVYKVAAKYKTIPKPAYEDLVSALTLRLCKCVYNWNPDAGLKLSSYVVNSLAGEAKNYFRDEMWAVKVDRSIRETALTANPTATAAKEDVEVIRTCAIPLSLEGCELGGETLMDLIPDNFDLPGRILELVGGSQITELLFENLQPEEKMLLLLKMEQQSEKNISETMQLSIKVVSEAWEELCPKVAGYYKDINEGNPLVKSTGSNIIRAKFAPPKTNFVELRKKSI